MTKQIAAKTTGQITNFHHLADSLFKIINARILFLYRKIVYYKIHANPPNRRNNSNPCQIDQKIRLAKNQCCRLGLLAGFQLGRPLSSAV